MSNHLMHMDHAKLESLATMVTARSGLAWGPRGRLVLGHAVDDRVQSLALSGVSGYIAHLRQDEGEWRQLLPRLTDGRTSFFRNEKQFDALSQVLLDDLTLRREERRLTLVSAGCGSGQEPYSLAIAVKESGLLNKGWQVDILAADIDPEAVDTARNALYSASDVEGVSADRLQRWFRRRGNRWQLREEIRDMVRWSVFNLADRESWPWTDCWGQVDAVLIRHVLVGLAPLAGKKITDALAELTAPGGIVLVGPEEGLPFAGDRFEPECWGGLVYYRRGMEKMKANPGHITRKALKSKGETDSGRGLAPNVPILPAEALEELLNAVEPLSGEVPENAWPRLEALLDEAAARGDIHPEALGLAVRLHLTLERWGEARELAERVILFSEDRVWAHILLGEAWAGEGRRTRARDEWETALGRLKRHPELRHDPFFMLDPATRHQNPEAWLSGRLSML